MTADNPGIVIKTSHTKVNNDDGDLYFKKNKTISMVKTPMLREQLNALHRELAINSGTTLIRHIVNEYYKNTMCKGCGCTGS